MILIEKVKVKSSKYYESIGYNIDERYIEINIKDLPKGSHVKITAKCHYCSKEKEISYKEYNKNISNSNKFSCGVKCGSLKSKENNLIKYGVESTNKLESTKQKIKDTILNKYGVDHVSKLESSKRSKSDKMKLRSKEISEKITEYWRNLDESEFDRINKKREETCLEKYGKTHISKVEEFKNKIRDTNIERYGGYTYQSNELKKKVELTNLEKWGVVNPSGLKFIRDKVSDTNIKKFGFKSPLMNNDIKLKILNTNLERWGVDNPMKLKNVVDLLKSKFVNKWGVDSYFKTEEFKDSKLGNILSNNEWRITNTEIGRDRNYIEYLGNNISRLHCDMGFEHSFKIDSSNYHNRIRNSVKLCTECFPISENCSIKEIELRNFISKIYDGEVLQNYRDNIEIDIYLPELKLGFEFNGLYWHSSKFKNKNYHIDKINFFKEKGIKIVNIWEDDWINKRNIIESQIKNLLGLTENKIFARRCQIREIKDSKISTKFLNENHIQGFIRSSVRLGLYNNGILVSIMTFDNLEGRKKMEDGAWNLSRFCSKIDHSVVGAASKLLNYFIKNWKPIRIISYADIDWSDGNLYYKLGFNLVDKLKPDYKYLINNERINKQRFTKKKLILLGHSSEKTESEIMESMNINKVYNSGKFKFELNF